MSAETVSKVFKNIKKKKSSGSDGLTQEQLCLGESVLIEPLLTVFNLSLSSGILIWNDTIMDLYRP